MKSTRSSNLIHIMSLTAMALLSALLLAGCYMAQETSPGAVSMNAVSSARNLTTLDGTDDVWVVGVVIDNSFEAKLKELRAQEDYRKYNDSPVTDSTKTLWKDMALKSAVRFEGGLPFFQFKMARFPGGGTFTNDFTIQGIPANKDYFLYLIVMDKAVTSIDSFSDYDALLATSPVHYLDPANAPPGWYFNRSGGGATINAASPIPAGWYSFTAWNPGYDVSGNMTSLVGEIWTDDSGKPISSQPFSVTPGESVTVPTLLVDY